MKTYGDLVGHRFPGATVTLPAHVSWLWAECVGAEPDRATAHPSVAYLLGLRGTGHTVDELLALFGSGPQEGPLLGECGFDFRRPLVPGRSYEAGGGVVAVERKRGGRSGAFDLITFEVSLSEGGRECVGCSFTWVIPRGGG
jgi:hypothetical protein